MVKERHKQKTLAANQSRYVYYLIFDLLDLHKPETRG